MKNSILNIGTVLNKTEQRQINGGLIDHPKNFTCSGQPGVICEDEQRDRCSDETTDHFDPAECE